MTTARHEATRLEAVTTLTFPPACVGAGSGRHVGTGGPAVGSTSPTRSAVRQAGLADIPAIARITQAGPLPAGVAPAAVSRARRLLLTHVAFEHGALWVEQVGDGPIIRAVAAIPAGQLLAQQSKRRDDIRRLGRASAPPPVPVPVPVFGLGKDLLAELRSVKAVWLLIEISEASEKPVGRPFLLEAALSWAREHSEPAHDPVMVVTDTIPESRAAESLGFVESRTRRRHWPWWLGIAAPVGGSFYA